MKLSVVRPMINIERKVNVWDSYAEITQLLSEKNSHGGVITLECYPTFNEQILKEKIIESLTPDLVIDAEDIFLNQEQINQMIQQNLTDDRIFGVMSHHKLQDFIDQEKLIASQRKVELAIQKKQKVIIYGVGASLIGHFDCLLYLDLSRWEIQTRYRSGRFSNWRANNAGKDVLRMIKRGYFFEWLVADRYKNEIMKHVDYLLDLHDETHPKMITAKDYQLALLEVVKQPFSLVPFFDPGVWGGHWMQDTFQIGQNEKNLAWSFNGVPEENSLLLDFSGITFEIPANNLVFQHGEQLLGAKVFGRFGHEFPIRFNFLDTVGGQNLSLQVHPKVDYAQSEFGAHYTQDESYYILEAGDDAVVYLGVNQGVQKEELIDALREAEKGHGSFDDQKYIYRHPIQKHDHYLIPSGTIHSSGKNSVVLEISATPNRFTFKLWDWDRVDFDGLPRPVNIDHGEPNIDIYKDEDWVKAELINQFEEISRGEGWVEEKTGLHETEFIETRRHTFNQKVLHQSYGGVNMLNLVEGAEAIVTSPQQAFKPFVVNYAQTFIIPASITQYEIAPHGKSIGKTIKTIKAFVR